MAIRIRLALIAALLVATVACHKPSSPVVPSPPSLTGTWVGTGFFPAGTTATFQIVQSGSSLTGTWLTDPCASCGPNGTVSGSVNGSSVALTFNAPGSAPSCPFPVAVTATVNGSQMSGTYATVNSGCSIAVTGNGSWTRQ